MTLFKCAGCPCTFLTERDKATHVEVFGAGNHVDSFARLHRSIEYGKFNEPAKWKKSSWGGEWINAEDEPQLAAAVKQNGKVTSGNYAITLDASGKILRRVIALL